MKDSKSILLLIVSLLLILVSFVLLWTAGFNFNNSSKPIQESIAVPKKIQTLSDNTTRDSLQKIYAATLSTLDTFDSTWTTADSLKGNLDLRLTEFYKLRNEIAELLKNPTNKEDINQAKQKIDELQKKVEQLRDRNIDVEKENQRLSAMLLQLRSSKDVSGARPIVYDNTEPALKNIPVTNIAATDMRLSAIMQQKNKEQETYQALQTDKFVGTFSVKNIALPSGKAEITVVVLRPDGKVLQTSAWETGRFDTRDGKKIYSCKVKFDYTHGENKRLSFSLNADGLQKGTYTMQLYYNGNIIGKTSKTLI